MPRCSNAPLPNTRSRPSFTWPPRPSSASPIAVPLSTFESNIQGTWCVLEACRRAAAQSAGRRGFVGQGLRRAGAACPTPKTPRLQGRHPYDVSKSCADILAQTYAHTYRLPVCVTRCGNFYGGGDLNWNRIVPGTIRSVLRGQRPVIRSDGTFIRDYFYVKDGAAAYMHLAGVHGARPEVRGAGLQLLDRNPGDSAGDGPAHPRPDGLALEAGRAQRGGQRDPAPVPVRRQGPARCSPGRPTTNSTRR